MCSGSGAGSYVRLIDFVYHSTLGLSVIKKKKSDVVPGLKSLLADLLNGEMSVYIYIYIYIYIYTYMEQMRVSRGKREFTPMARGMSTLSSR